MSNKRNNKNLAVGKINLILIALSMVFIIIGFLLMTGSTTDLQFNEDIFSLRRVTVGPMISLFGFVFMIVAILWKPKDK